MLTWHFSDRYQQHYLALDGEQVALVDECVGGGAWRVQVNRQRPMGILACGHSPSLVHGKKMAERWAQANLARLEVEVADRIRRRPMQPLPVGAPRPSVAVADDPPIVAPKRPARKARRRIRL